MTIYDFVKKIIKIESEILTKDETINLEDVYRNNSRFIHSYSKETNYVNSAHRPVYMVDRQNIAVNIDSSATLFEGRNIFHGRTTKIGLFIMNRMFCNDWNNGAMEAHFRRDEAYHEKRGPFPLNWSEEKDYYVTTKMRMIQMPRNPPLPMYNAMLSNRFTADAIPNSICGYTQDEVNRHLRRQTFFIPIEWLEDGDWYYDENTDLMVSIAPDNNPPMHPYDPRRKQSYFAEQEYQMYINSDYPFKYYYCVDDKADRRYPQLFVKNGAYVTELDMQPSDEAYQDGFIYVFYKEFDPISRKNITRQARHSLIGRGENFEVELEKWLNQFGIFTSYKQALASTKEQVEVEKVINDRIDNTFKVKERQMKHEEEINNYEFKKMDRELSHHEKINDIPFRRAQMTATTSKDIADTLVKVVTALTGIASLLYFFREDVFPGKSK